MVERRYTLIYHYYLGHHWYNVELKRVSCRESILKRYKRNPALHFVVKGWPKVAWSNGSDYFRGSNG